MAKNETEKIIICMRLLLIAGGVGWAISVLGIFLPWEIILKHVQKLGAEDYTNMPMLYFWFKMAAGAFTAIGILFLIAAVNPQKYRFLTRFLAVFSFIEGIILLFAGFNANLGFMPWIPDVIYCLLIGIGLFFSDWQLSKIKKERDRQTN